MRRDYGQRAPHLRTRWRQLSRQRPPQRREAERLHQTKGKIPSEVRRMVIVGVKRQLDRRLDKTGAGQPDEPALPAFATRPASPRAHEHCTPHQTGKKPTVVLMTRPIDQLWQPVVHQKRLKLFQFKPPHVEGNTACKLTAKLCPFSGKCPLIELRHQAKFYAFFALRRLQITHSLSGKFLRLRSLPEKLLKAKSTPGCTLRKNEGRHPRHRSKSFAHNGINPLFPPS
jgi:hypothetical protein